MRGRGVRVQDYLRPINVGAPMALDLAVTRGNRLRHWATSAEIQWKRVSLDSKQKFSAFVQKSRF
jgi:hypothetical protein